MTKMRNVEPSAVSYRLRMGGMVGDRRLRDVAELFHVIKLSGVNPNGHCFNVLIKGFVGDDNIKEVKFWYDELVKSKDNYQQYHIQGSENRIGLAGRTGLTRNRRCKRSAPLLITVRTKTGEKPASRPRTGRLGQTGNRLPRCPPPSPPSLSLRRRVAVRKGKTLSERKSCARKERCCVSIAAISSHFAVAEGSRCRHRLQCERVVANFHRRRIFDHGRH
ncbi:hypothetical protein Ahy_A06g029332 isoform A [Arachis hypogaea]|uniref:Pentatricopeptide repeat-containing protein n=1 Tax=Arachis hypogaea TaxID=3818 RepID=A0A445CT21_ARAHY|nr:hypothetical protein Ahy_A06g029332 isoform A [Arachis hypogaea]